MRERCLQQVSFRTPYSGRINDSHESQICRVQPSPQQSTASTSRSETWLTASVMRTSIKGLWNTFPPCCSRNPGASAANLPPLCDSLGIAICSSGHAASRARDYRMFATQRLHLTSSRHFIAVAREKAIHRPPPSPPVLHSRGIQLPPET